MKKVFLSAGIALVGFIGLNGQQLAFPGAEGYGKYASGGRGGRVIEVTNLKDADRAGTAQPGSFRAALETEGTDPITIVFKVSGVITLTSPEIKCGRPNMTIAGQTAPGDGICIRKGSLKFSGENLIIRYLRFRPGDEFKTNVSGLNIENTRNIMVDHCSFSWAIEENLTLYDNKYTTVQWCIISEALYDSYHTKGPRGYAGQWGGQYASYHHNLLAHNKSRSPRINGSRAHDTMAIVDFRNNIIYNWGSSGAIYGGEEEIPGGECKTNFVNNYYKKGPATSGSYFAAPTYVTADNTAYGYAEWYFSGNIMEGNPNGVNDDNWKGVDASSVGGIDNIKITTEIEVSEIVTQKAEEAFNLVLASAGATLPKLDSIDMRILAEVKGEVEVTGDGVTGENKGIIDSQTAVGGWPEYVNYDPPADTDHDGIPDDWEDANSLDKNNSDDGKVIAADGYSNLEHYLNSIDGVTGTPIVGIENYEYQDYINIFPNPAFGEINIHSENEFGKIEIIDLAGIVVIKKEKISKEINIKVESLDPGMYFVRIQFVNGNQHITPIKIN